MVKLGCFFSACEIAYKKLKQEGKFEELRNVRLFKPPRNSVQFEKWKKAIPKGKKELTKDDLLCELHFTPQDFVRFEEIINVTKYSRWKSKPNLRCDAVPSIFYLFRTTLHPKIVSKVSSNSARVSGINKSTSKASLMNREIATESKVKELQNHDVVLNLEDTVVFSMHDDMSDSVTSLSKSLEISNTIDDKFNEHLNRNDISSDGLIVNETPTESLIDTSVARNLFCHVTYCNKNQKCPKFSCDCIKAVDYQPSLHEEQGICFNKASADALSTDSINDNILAIDDTLVSKDTTNLTMARSVNNVSLKSENVSNDCTSSKKMPLSPKLRNNRSCNKLFYKKIKNVETGNKCNMELSYCFPSTLPSDSPEGATYCIITNELNSSNASLKHEEQSKADFQTVDFSLVTDESQYTYFDNHLGIVESEVEIIPVFHDDEALSKFDILAHIKQIELSSLWSYTLIQEKAIIFMRWNESYDNIIKQIFICSNLKIKVYVHRISVEIDAYEKIDCWESLQTLIHIVEGIPPCDGFADSIGRSTNCKGFVSSAYRSRPNAQRCIHCKLYKKKVDKEKERQESLRNKFLKVRLQCQELMKENSLLCKHLESCCGVELKSYIIENTELGPKDII